MMVLAVNVGGDRSAKRDEAGARRHRRKKSTRHKDVDQFGDGDASLASQKAACGIKGEHPIEPRKIDDAILIVERRIAISPSGAARNQRRCIGSYDSLQFGDFVRAVNITLKTRIPPPPGEQSMPRSRRRSRGDRHSSKTAGTS